MHRNKVIFCALPLTFFISGKVLAATRTPTSGQSQQVGATAAKQGKATNKGPASAVHVEEVEVRARRASTMASSATKSNTPLIETAQSVTVITRDEMDVRGVLSLNQAIRYAKWQGAFRWF